MQLASPYGFKWSNMNFYLPCDDGGFSQSHHNPKKDRDGGRP